MLMTEEEAMKKWCHKVLAYSGSNIGCIGPSCAAWRWNDPEEWVADESQRRGYCGLAGNPNPVIVMAREGV